MDREEGRYHALHSGTRDLHRVAWRSNAQARRSLFVSDLFNDF